MLITFILTDRCNASCTHCTTSCGPRLSRYLPPEQIETTMEQAAELQAPDKPAFCFTGGEPFLDFELLLRLVKAGARHGAWMSCVSNGYWASSEARARRLLSQLAEAGLRCLAVSSSPFHRRYVPESRTRRALCIAREVGLDTMLKHVSTATDNDEDRLIVDWARDLPVGYVQEIPIAPSIRAGASLPAQVYSYGEGLPEGACPGAAISVREDSQVYTCCNPGGFTPMLALGRLGEDDLKTLTARLERGAVQRVLNRDGPIRFAREIQRRGQGHRLRSAYTSVCDLCAHVAGDAQLADIAQDHAVAGLVQELDQIFPPASGA